MEILLRNNTGNQGKNTLVKGFVVRLKVFNNILNELKLSQSDKPEQNYLIIGQRGAGKTTLLYRLKYAIEDDPMLKENILPIMLSEEQYHLTDLVNLWESVSEQLDEIPGFSGLSRSMQETFTGNRYDEEKAYDLLEAALRENSKKLVLFIENFDVLLKKFGREGQQRLREILSTSKSLRIIGSSTTYFEGIISYTDPFYDFFKIIQLNGLSKSETFKLLLKIAEQSNESEKIELLLRRSATRVESLRRLTGGNPRMMSYLYQIFLDNANGKAIKDLYRLLDDMTFLYKSELDQLSAQQQKVIDIIARNWDAISVKEIAAVSRMESKHISSVLNMLDRNQVIERISTKTKNNLYRLKDRFLNIWYLMRFGRKKDKENILWLVRFYDAWCNKSELSERVLHYINNLIDGDYDNVAAIDMVNTFLSCKNVSALDKYKLFKTTKSTLPKELIRGLKLSQKDWFETIRDLVKKEKYGQAISALEEMDDKGILYHSYSYWILYNQREYEKAADNLAWLSEQKKDAITAFTLAELYENKLSDYAKAIKYYEIALDREDFQSALRLGQIYHFVKHQEARATEYYKIAIAHDIHDAIMGLATIAFTNDNYEEARRLSELAVEKGVTGAYISLSILKQEDGDVDGAISDLERAIELGEDFALITLGDLYLKKTKGNETKAKELFKKAVAKKLPHSYHALGRYLLEKEKNVEAAIKVLTDGVKHKDEDAAHLLAHHYQDTKDFEKAEEMFVKSFDMGKRTSLLCLANCAFHDGVDDRKAKILELFEQKMSPITEPLILLEYCKLLVWNDKFQSSIDALANGELKIIECMEGENEDYKEDLLAALATYFIRLIAKKQYNFVKLLFQNEVVDYKQILKPVYYAFMQYLKEEYPNEHLKAGSEMDETIEEIIKEIEKVRAMGR